MSTPAEVDKWTGHRLYSVKQIPRLNKILYLRDSGLNVSEIALALTMDEQSLLAQLDKKRIEIENTIQAEREKLRKIELTKSEVQGGKGELHYNKSRPGLLTEPRFMRGFVFCYTAASLIKARQSHVFFV